jgi:hypothetical protein
MTKPGDIRAKVSPIKQDGESHLRIDPRKAQFVCLVYTAGVIASRSGRLTHVNRAGGYWHEELEWIKRSLQDDGDGLPNRARLLRLPDGMKAEMQGEGKGRRVGL